MNKTNSTTDKPVKPAVQPQAKLATEPKTKQAITIGKSPDEIFAFWRDFKNLESFMKDITSIEVLSETRHFPASLNSREVFCCSRFARE